jgi:hypothetical protein
MIGSPDPVWSEKATPLGEQADQMQKKRQIYPWKLIGNTT